MATQSTAYPLGVPAVSGNSITVDQHVNEPTRVTRFLQDYLLLNRQRFLLDVLLDNGGGMSGGAIIFDSEALPSLYAERDVQQVAPGAVFPLVTFSRLVPGMAKPEKWGGQFEVTYEARDRNDTRLLGRDVTKLANTIIRKINQRCMGVVADAITSMAGATTITSVGGYEDVNLSGSNPTLAKNTPAADIGQVMVTNELTELGLLLTTLIIHPLDWNTLTLVYGTAAGARAMLAEHGITDVFVTQQKAQGSYWVAAGRGQVGQYRVEQPLETVSVEDKLLEKFTVKSSVRPAMFVDNAYGIYVVNGINV